MIAAISSGAKYEANTQIEFSMIVCGGCGIPFMIPAKHHQHLIKSNGEFHCPNGCVREYLKETVENKLKRQLAEKNSEITQLTTSKIQMESQLKTAQNKINAIHAGKCPDCGKQYKYLANHMAKKHNKK